jgi:hypothetical protein
VFDSCYVFVPKQNGHMISWDQNKANLEIRCKMYGEMEDD